jgi:hypothetical protein
LALSGEVALFCFTQKTWPCWHTSHLAFAFVVGTFRKHLLITGAIFSRLNQDLGPRVPNAGANLAHAALPAMCVVALYTVSVVFRMKRADNRMGEELMPFVLSHFRAGALPPREEDTRLPQVLRIPAKEYFGYKKPGADVTL